MREIFYTRFLLFISEFEFRLLVDKEKRTFFEFCDIRFIFCVHNDAAVFSFIPIIELFERNGKEFAVRSDKRDFVEIELAVNGQHNLLVCGDIFPFIVEIEFNPAVTLLFCLLNFVNRYRTLESGICGSGTFYFKIARINVQGEIRGTVIYFCYVYPDFGNFLRSVADVKT